MPLKFSIVTPSYNSEKFIAETIESVISQRGEFSIEYIIMDNFSTDSTPSIIEEYRHNIQCGARKINCLDVQIQLVSESDSGMYDAVNKAFSRATGDVFAWINSDDIYLPGAFAAIQNTLKTYPQINWLKGITSYIDENSTIYSVGKCRLYLQEWLKEGIYGPILYFVQQDSVFWRSNLWKLVRTEIPEYTQAGDYVIWRKFAEHHPLYSLNAYVSCFRKVQGQKSEDIDRYWQEALAKNGFNKHLASKIKISNRLQSFLPDFIHTICCKLMFKKQNGYLVSLEDSMLPVLSEKSIQELNRKIIQ